MLKQKEEKEEIIKKRRRRFLKERSKWSEKRSIYMPASKEIILHLLHMPC